MITSNTKDFKDSITLKVITPLGDSLANKWLPEPKAKLITK